MPDRTCHHPKPISVLSREVLIARIYSGEYDEDYLTYLRALLEGMTQAGLICYVVSPGLYIAKRYDE
jgi:hypothetical protein